MPVTFAEQDNRPTLPTVPLQLESEEPEAEYFALCYVVWVLIAVVGAYDMIMLFALRNIKRGRGADAIHISKFDGEDYDLDDFDLDDFDDDDHDDLHEDDFDEEAEDGERDYGEEEEDY